MGTVIKLPVKPVPFVWRVYSDNHRGELLTNAAYQELRLQMSSGDFGSHRAHRVKLSSVREPVLHFYADDAKQRARVGFTPAEADELSWDTVTVAQLKQWEGVT